MGVTATKKGTQAALNLTEDGMDQLVDWLKDVMRQTGFLGKTRLSNREQNHLEEAIVACSCQPSADLPASCRNLDLAGDTFKSIISYTLTINSNKKQRKWPKTPDCDLSPEPHQVGSIAYNAGIELSSAEPPRKRLRPSLRPTSRLNPSSGNRSESGPAGSAPGSDASSKVLLRTKTEVTLVCSPEPRDLNSPRVSDEVLFSEREESGSDALVDESTDFAGQQAEGSVPRSKPIDIPPRRHTMSTSADYCGAVERPAKGVKKEDSDTVDVKPSFIEGAWPKLEPRS
ncbi:hypothetical protein VTN02DRAFT_2217 [Thermoascus thermophilus]